MTSDSKLVIHFWLSFFVLAVVFIQRNYGQIYNFPFNSCYDLVYCVYWTFSRL